MSNTISESLEKNIQKIKDSIYNKDNLTVRKVKVDSKRLKEINLVFLEGIANTDNIQEYIIKPIKSTATTLYKSSSLIDEIADEVIETANVKITSTYEEIIDAIINGNTVVLIEGQNRGIIAKTAKLKERNLEQVTSERSPRGPMVGLTENIDTNVSLILGMVKTPDLCVESKDVGKYSKTKISMLFLKNIVDQDVLGEVRKIIDQISVNYILESRVVTEEIDGKYSLFNLSEESERPDVIISSLYGGKVVIFVDGNPFGIILPGLFISSFEAPDEYNQKHGRFTLRLLRFIALIMSVYIPAAYVVMSKYYANDLPQKVSKTLFKGDELIPAFWTMLILIILLNMLIDATFRIPQGTIFLISLVATITIGEMAVSSKLIHPFSLICIGITFIATFLIINKGMGAPIKILRLLFLVIGNFFGLSGLVIGTTIMIIYMISLRSVGVPYLSPIIPFRMEEMKDTFYRGRLARLNSSRHSFPETDQ
ncbi:spore germination protein [Fictibacillus barbaricus]|uniref:Spore germination protein n=1 Tax=Fictibacillus barbaricus TaxID=182136 RepID=A0ABS2ZI35_9BACL|nr:spore germination protein [Fictibacillus barbaricus]MBN3547067.1 spore germination protein [Fictibacillus barbaricus]GGB46187.1 spore germination protein [Fictibacillus barbaricus]